MTDTGDMPSVNEDHKPRFDELGLSDKVVSAVKSAGYEHPTPIQAQAIPEVLKRRDVLGIAQTGTGKTASFTLPMLTLLERGRARARMPRTLVLAPTRELAAQINDNFVKYGVNHKLTVALLIGGVSFEEQDRKLTRGADVLIATPGRLLDHFERGKLLLTGVELFVIDEADRMLDMGFIPDIERICTLLPVTRQTVLFSATMAKEIERLANTFMANPARIEVARASSTASTVTQWFLKSGKQAYEKRAVLRHALREHAQDLRNAIIFCNRKRDISTLQRSLEKHGFNVGALHGDMDQRSRMDTLEKFRKNELAILVASDVAARGLDIPDVSHVVNYDVPIHAEDYVHRIGRTGRAGRTGVSYSIATPLDKKAVAAIEETIGQSVSWLELEGLEETKPAAEPKAKAEKADRPKKPRSEKTEKSEAPNPAEKPAQTKEERQYTPRQDKPKGRKGRDDRFQQEDITQDEWPAFLLRPVKIAQRKG